MEIKIAPSVLAADFCRLGQEVQAVCAAGCDYLHLDVMDGHFVPNISFGQPVVAALARVASCPLDVHLMIERPERYIEDFAAAGAAVITVHHEACPHLHRTLQQIRLCGARAGVSINPATPPSVLEWILDEVDLVLVMSVNPGFGGQRFIPAALAKIRQLRTRLAERGLATEIEVDGGIVVDNVASVAEAGATVMVSGTGIFGQGNYAEAIESMRQACRAIGV